MCGQITQLNDMTSWFVLWDINHYLHFMPFLQPRRTQINEFLHHESQGHACLNSSPIVPHICVQCWKFPPVHRSWGRQLWRRTGNLLLIFLQFYVYDLRFKAGGPTTFLTEFQTLYVSVNWVRIGSGNGLSPVWHQAITWTNAGLLSIGRLGTNFSEIQIKIQIVDQWSTRIPPPHRRGWHCSKSQGSHFESDIADKR